MFSCLNVVAHITKKNRMGTLKGVIFQHAVNLVPFVQNSRVCRFKEMINTELHNMTFKS